MKELVLDSIKPQPEPISQPPSNASFLLHLELLTEYFGFNPMDFVDEIINTANDLLYKAMDELEKILRLEIKDEALVERGMASIETLFENAIDKYFDKFELYCMSQIFVLPHKGRVILPHYADLDLKTATSKEENILEGTVADKRMQTYAKGKFLNYKLTKELNALKSSSALFESLEKQLKALEAAIGHNGDSDLSSQLESLKENVSTMKSLSMSIRKRTMDMSFKELVAETDERTRYLKSSIATYLQGQTQNLNQSLTQTPRKRRLSRLSLGKNTPIKRKSMIRHTDSQDYSEEYRGAMQIGTAQGVEIFREMMDDDEGENE